LGGALLAERRRVDPAEERGRVVVALELRHPRRDLQAGDPADRLPLDRQLEGPEEELGVRERRLGEYDGELVASDPAGDVRSAHHQTETLRDLREDRVPSEVADLLVDRLE